MAVYDPRYQKLVQMQSMPLDLKIEASFRRIKEWYNAHDGAVCVAFSGGADSTVLLDLVRSCYPEVKGVFVNTGLEFPEIVRFVKSVSNIDIIRPKMTFKEVLTKYGYPVVSKEQAQYIEEARLYEKMREFRLNGRIYRGKWSKHGTVAQRWRFLLDAPFKISARCCGALKKQPLISYQKDHGVAPYVGIMAEESRVRTISYIKYTCNAFNLQHPQSRPLMFWTKNDTLLYLKTRGLKFAECYGDIIDTSEGLKFTGEQRTGCTFCLFGLHRDHPNRIQRLEKTHPQLWKYCLDELGLRTVMDYMGIPWSLSQGQQELFSESYIEKTEY